MSNIIYVQSYYQLPFQRKPRFEDASIRNKLDTIVTYDDTLIVSKAHFDWVEGLLKSSLHTFSQDEIDYLTAVSCDLEVAMEEKLLQLLAAKKGFQYVIQPTSMRMSLNFDLFSSEPKGGEAEASDEASGFQGNIFVINTHGKPGTLDGPYESAIYNDLSIDRIVVDACSSAVRGERHAPSMQEKLLTLASGMRRSDDLEVVGFLRPYSVLDEQAMLEEAFFGTHPERFSVISNYTVIEKEMQESMSRKPSKRVKRKQELSFKETLLSALTTITRDMFPIALLTASPLGSKDRAASSEGVLNEAQKELLRRFDGDVSEVEREVERIRSELASNTTKKGYAYRQFLNMLKDRRKAYIQSIDTRAVLDCLDAWLQISQSKAQYGAFTQALIAAEQRERAALCGMMTPRVMSTPRKNNVSTIGDMPTPERILLNENKKDENIKRTSPFDPATSSCFLSLGLDDNEDEDELTQHKRHKSPPHNFSFFSQPDILALDNEDQDNAFKFE